MRIERSLIALTACALMVTALGTPAQAAERRPQKTLVFILAENEYRAWRTIPEFGQILEDKYGFQCEYLTSSTDDKDPNRFFIPRMERVKKADLVVVFARRRALPSEQIQILKEYLDSGKPLIGIRTACHAFDANLVVPKEGGAPVAANVRLSEGLEQWKTFDKDVFGCSYHGHYEPGIVTVVTVNPEKKGHPILTGVPETFESPSWLYLVAPLAPTAEALMMGKIPGKDAEAVLLTNTYKRGSRIVYTSLGHWDDFKLPAFQRILINSVFWTMKMAVPKD
jgi:type 1 glutamine amidotransferase